MLQDLAIRAVSAIASLLMIPVRGVSVILARLLYPASIVGFLGSIGLAVLFAVKGAWSDFAVSVLTILFSLGLFLASRAIIRRWYTPETRPIVKYVARETFY